MFIDHLEVTIIETTDSLPEAIVIKEPSFQDALLELLEQPTLIQVGCDRWNTPRKAS